MKNKIVNSNVSVLKNLGYSNTIVNCVFVGDNITIGSNCTLKNVIVNDNTDITDSVIEDAQIGNCCTIGPFSRIRPKTFVGDDCKIGNFVEIKNSRLEKGVKVSHMAYIGDAIVGENTNIGCGVVFANFDGISKHVTLVGKNCFVGSNCNLIAPVKLADDTFVCAGTTLCSNTKDGDFLIGRVRAESNDKYLYYIKNKKNDRQ